MDSNILCSATQWATSPAGTTVRQLKAASFLWAQNRAKEKKKNQSSYENKQQGGSRRGRSYQQISSQSLSPM